MRRWPFAVALALALATYARPAAAFDAASCTGCHRGLTQGKRQHTLLQSGGTCADCHAPVAGTHGPCKSDVAGKWSLTSPTAELCTMCHAAEPASAKVRHQPVLEGSCTDCHDPHASVQPKLLKAPPEQLCTSCHDPSELAKGAVPHAPAMEGRCLGCHAPHASDNANLLKATGNEACLGCHDTKASVAGAPSPAKRLDLGEGRHVHPAVEGGSCTDCHEAGHGGALPHLLKKAAPGLCYDCHGRKDETPFVHGAVKQGDCNVCHAPHSSKNEHLLQRASTKDLCFECHEDDVTGRPFVHSPVADGVCTDCHDPHGSKYPFNLVQGRGKQVCYACHEPVDGGKHKHLALERGGCTACHDPHGANNPSMLVKPVKELCTGCHPAQASGTHVTSFGRAPHKVDGGPDPVRPGKDFSCVSCHDPHGSDHPRLFRDADTAIDACDRCHGNISGKHPGAPDVSHRTPDGRAAAPSPGKGAKPPASSKPSH